MRTILFVVFWAATLTAFDVVACGVTAPKAVDCRVEFAARGMCPCDAGRDVGGE